jgi:hypothetical protein
MAKFAATANAAEFAAMAGEEVVNGRANPWKKGPVELPPEVAPAPRAKTEPTKIVLQIDIAEIKQEGRQMTISGSGAMLQEGRT